MNTRLVTGTPTDLLPSTTGATTTLTGDWKVKDTVNTTVQGTVTGTGAVTATIIIEVSNDGTNAVGTSAGTITLSGTTTASDGFVMNAGWKFIRARVTALTGTGAAAFVKICG
jgi:hypothetical protein